MSNDELKSRLVDKLKQSNCLWSYQVDSVKSIPDDLLIEKAMVYLDLEDIDQLFVIFPYSKVKKVWLENLVSQLDYYYTLNRFFAWYYFKAKRPDTYIKAMATRQLNKLTE